MLIDLAWKARGQRQLLESANMQQALKANGRCGEVLVGYAYPAYCKFNAKKDGKCLHHYKLGLKTTEPHLLDADLVTALKLLWFFLPNEEPFDPHTKKADEKEKNKRWFEACELYQKYVGRL